MRLTGRIGLTVDDLGDAVKGVVGVGSDHAECVGLGTQVARGIIGIGRRAGILTDQLDQVR